MWRYFGTEPLDASGNSVERSGCASALVAPAIKAVSTTSSVHTLLIRTATYTIARFARPTRVSAVLPRILAAVVLALLALPAAASAAPRVQHIKYRYGPLTIKPGQNTISFDGDDVPRPKRPGWIVGFRPNLELVNGKIPGVDVLHLHHAVWLINGAADLRGRRGEDERQAAAAVRLAPRPRGPLGAQPHGPQPAAQPRPRLPHLHDRLRPRLVAAGQADAARSTRAGSTSRAAARIPSSTCTAAPARNGRFTYPRDAPNAYGGGSARNQQHRPARRRAGADRGAPAPRRAVHGPDCSRAAGGPSTCSARARSTGSRRARSRGTWR